jgi:general stress protein 26
MTKADLFHFIANRKLGVLGSISPEGNPQSALVGIAATEDLEIIFDTVSSTRKYRNLRANPAASLAIGWEGEATVQYEGEARQATGSELERYLNIYFGKWPECAGHLSWPGIAYFVVRPKWLRYSDYDRNPPQVEEFTFK